MDGWMEKRHVCYACFGVVGAVVFPRVLDVALCVDSFDRRLQDLRSVQLLWSPLIPHLLASFGVRPRGQCAEFGRGLRLRFLPLRPAPFLFDATLLPAEYERH